MEGERTLSWEDVAAVEDEEEEEPSEWRGFGAAMGRSGEKERREGERGTRTSSARRFARWMRVESDMGAGGNGRSEGIGSIHTVGERRMKGESE